jgi:hypothetical protein
MTQQDSERPLRPDEREAAAQLNDVFLGHAQPPRHATSTPGMVCPACHMERADYEGPDGAWLPTCPNCGSAAQPTPASESCGHCDSPLVVGTCEDCGKRYCHEHSNLHVRIDAATRACPPASESPQVECQHQNAQRLTEPGDYGSLIRLGYAWCRDCGALGSEGNKDYPLRWEAARRTLAEGEKTQ